MDRIKITVDEQERINQWAHTNLTEDMDLIIPFNECVIEVNSQELEGRPPAKYIFVSSEKYLTIYLNGFKDLIIRVTRAFGLKCKQASKLTVSAAFDEQYKITSTYMKKNMPDLWMEVLEDQGGEDRSLSHARSIMNSIMNLFQYIAYHKQDLSEIEVMEVKNSVKKKGLFVYDGTVRLEKTYELKRIVTRKEKLNHKITCEEWSVRGHMRHYQSGKVVFIAPYLKGKNKGHGRRKDKTYKLSGRRNTEV